ncbi:MAG: hypothetical protein F6K19_03085 [Cyanothece sp. SIO1E1]|nr:hypothetical protein [Cyanothece sp. SIO1E1]
MPRRKQLFRSRLRQRTSSAWVGYIFLFFLAIALVRILLPFIILAGMAWGAYKIWQIWYPRHQAHQLKLKQQQAFINSAFYQLIQQYQGRVSILDLSMTAHIKPEEAKQFLDTKAKEFMADFEPTDQGEVLYVFNSLRNTSPHAEQFSAPITPPQSPQPSQPHDPPPLSQPPQTERPLQASLNQTDLARRLGLSSSAVDRKKFAPDFVGWSRERDPQGVAWKYRQEDKLFYRTTRRDSH